VSAVPLVVPACDVMHRIRNAHITKYQTKNGSRTRICNDPAIYIRGPFSDYRRIDELERTIASMRKSLGEHNNPVGQNSAGSVSPVPETAIATGTKGFTSKFGHPLDMLARTAADSHSPGIDRFNAGNTFPNSGPLGSQQPRTPRLLGPSESIPNTWSADLSGIDPVRRGWVDIEDAKFLFER
jgi:hypothetical protein